MSLRVVHIVSSLMVGGMEQFAIRLAASQQADGLCVSIVALQGGPLAETAARLGVETCILGGRSRAIRVVKAAALFRRLRPVIVHGHNATSLQYATLARRCTGARIVVTCHGRGKADYREPPARLWKTVDRVVCVSGAVARELPAAVPPERVSVVRNGVETAAPARDRVAVRSELALGDAVTAIIVARIDGMKGHDTLLEAWRSVSTAAPQALLLVAGDGAERPAMEALARRLGVADSVRFLGFRPDVPDLLAASDIFVLPSLSEGLPLSVLEAMAAGLPVVASDVGGVPEVVEREQTGILISSRDAAALGAAIARMAGSPKLRSAMGSAGRQRAQAEFSFDAMRRRYGRIYAELQ